MSERAGTREERLGQVATGWGKSVQIVTSQIGIGQVGTDSGKSERDGTCRVGLGQVRISFRTDRVK